MKDTITLFLGLNDFHWRGNAYQWFFYAGILLTLLMERRKMVRIVFGWVPLLFLVLMFNPLCIKLLNLAGLFNQAYFTRLFSFMPLMYVIARGAMLLLCTENHWLKLAGTVVVCVAICVAGKNIYLESWLTKAENLAKVPQETLEILDAVNAWEDRNVSVAGIDESAVYMRQVADIVMPYGRKMTELGRVLSMDPPDVQQAMTLAGEQDVDYVVAHKTNETLAAFAEMEYAPYALTDNYAIYKVENVPRVRRTLNDKRRVISATFYNASGNPEASRLGYTTVEYAYDANGNKIRETYLDQEGFPVTLPEGYSSMELSWYASGNKKQLVYLDQDGNPVLKDGRYITRYAYNVRYEVIREAYYDQDGKPMKRSDTLYAAREMKYRASGLISAEHYFDEAGRPTLSSQGYAQLEREYDDALQPIHEIYFDTEGNKVGGVGVGEPARMSFLAKSQCTGGAKADDDGVVSFETVVEGNRFSAVRFQIYDLSTGNYLLSFGDAFGTGEVTGVYKHELPSGLYTLVFKGNTNLKDETISTVEYMENGETINFHYRVDALDEKMVTISEFHIGR